MIDEVLRRRRMCKVRQQCALARWNATFWIDFHQLFEHLAQCALRCFFECLIRSVGALSNGTLDATKTVIRSVRKGCMRLTRRIQFGQRKCQERQRSWGATSIMQEAAHQAVLE